MEFSIPNAVTWTGIILVLMLCVLGAKYASGIREGFFKMGQRGLAIYLVPVAITFFAVLTVAFKVRASLEWNLDGILLAVALATFDAFIIIEARPNAKSYSKK
ncbi:MAG: hypothetical protein LBJ20_07860 [Candidatus Methanoplasma sp.]|jgi:hypothetical protein|nr:hypothetical protein [Candidatus Methanoplasma sp.]